ncbi:UNVERIFIED_CONTAM: hypothetical protein Slati_1172700 [Sesamum latifolium]|uniref:Uncharacterized protein n=1 Tax=Sesamum latifolium TaxID=2727402 RepID=A0AAW2XI86_9LAMI
METAGSAQALQVVLGTSLAPASETTIPGPTDPLTEPPRHSTSSNTSSRGHPPQKVSPTPR